MELVEGDTIVMGSDGLFDNVFNSEIVSILAIHTDVVEAGTCFLLLFYWMTIIIFRVVPRLHNFL